MCLLNVKIVNKATAVCNVSNNCLMLRYELKLLWVPRWQTSTPVLRSWTPWLNGYHLQVTFGSAGNRRNKHSKPVDLEPQI